MPRILAIDWDRKEARALVLQSGPTGTSIAGVWAAKLENPEGVPLTGKQVGARLAEVMGSDAVGKAITIVGVGRDNVQIKQLSLPPAPEDELPELVRFQAEREFTALGSQAALDYIPLSGDAQTPHQVLAVALSPAGITEAREVSQAAGLEPDRITVRTLAAVSLVLRANVVNANGVSLIVNPLSDEADLNVVEAGKVVLMRTVRLPDAEQLVARQRTLTGEIRRTIAAARQQSADRPIDQVVLCGNAAGIDKFDGLGDDLGIPVNIFDPVANAPAGLTGTRVPAESLSRFSAVLGMALSEADRRAPIVDFLNVRRRAEKQRFGRTHAIAVATAALLLLAIGAYMWRQMQTAKNELADVRTQIAEHKARIKQFEKQTAEHGAVERWKANDANWLEVLGNLSHGIREVPINLSEAQYRETPFPLDKDVVVKSLIFTRPGDRNAEGGEVQLTQAVAKDGPAMSALAARIRDYKDKPLRVQDDGGKTDNTVPGYTWGFTMKIGVEPRPEEVEPAATPTDAKAGSAAAATPATKAAKTASDNGKATPETKAASDAKATPEVKTSPEPAKIEPTAESKAQPANVEKK